MVSAPDVRGLLADIAGNRASVRFAAAKNLVELSSTEPAKVYRRFDEVAELVHHPNRILRWNAMRVIANLALVDRAGRIDSMLDEYFAPIRGDVMITAAHAIAGAAKIAAAKPYLAPLIAEQVLGVEQGEYATRECRNVAIGHAMKALEQIAPLLPDAKTIRAFAERHLDNPRPSTRRKAEHLLARLTPKAMATV